MLGDIISPAEAVAGWAGLGVKLPKDLARSIEVFEAIRYVEIGHPVVFDVADVTPDNAEARIREFADQLVPALPLVPVVGARGSSVLQEAKRQALTLAARDVLSKAAAAVPGIITQLAPEFDRAASEFADAVQALPDDLSDAAIVQAGPSVLADYKRAAQAQGVIAGFDSWIASLRELPGIAGQVDPVTRVLRPANRDQLAKLEHANSKSYGQLNPLYVVAVREGVEFGMNTPAEGAAIRARIEALPVQDKPIRVA
ncbi:MAG: hypothetical protein JWN96_1248 [Mycobacterium sp.]|jgi:hypothetical protein|nr:hypothetical protein [Mycobacterium sp.]